MEQNKSNLNEKRSSSKKEESDNHLQDTNHSQISDLLDKEEIIHSSHPKNNKSFLIKNLNESIESPRTKLAKFIPEIPFQLNNSDQLYDGKIFIQKNHEKDSCNESTNIHISISFDDDLNDKEHAYSKSCDCSEEISQSLQEHCPIMSRSFSEDVLQHPSAQFQRRISVASYKGKLMGVPRVRPGEKIVRSPSIPRPITQHPSTDRIEAEDLPKNSRFTTEQKLVAFCLCLVDFTSFLSMSIIAPFFPREAQSKGMREAVSGFVFGIYALVMMLTSPIFGKLLPLIGAKLMFLTGVFLCGSCNVIFGVLDKVEGQLEFTILCFTVRSFEAIGAAAFCTASCTILIDQFPDDIGTIFGFTETCIGVGMSIGPAIGGALYSVGGFGLPFFTLGGFVILIVPLCWYLMRFVEDPELEINTSISYKKLLCMPHVIIVCIILAVTSQAQGFIDPTLEPHMRQYGLNTGIVGLLFLLLSGAYALSSPIVGWISGKIENKYPLMVVGLALATFGMLLVGPSSFLPINGSVWLSIIALTLMGFSFAAACVPTFESILISALNAGVEDDITTYSVVSGLWNSVYSLGEVTGPSLGGVLSDFFTFPEASSFMAFCTLAALVIAIIGWMNPFMCFGPYNLLEDTENKRSSSQNNSIETTPLPSREVTPLHDDNVHNYGSLWEDIKNPLV